jgi:hypothetical protein
MAGTVIADKVQAASTSTLEIMNGVALTPPLIEDVNGVQVGTFCRAWVNFNGTGTVAIRASFNVSSITDNGTGDYTVNFTNAMPDANYAVQCSLQGASGWSGVNGQASVKVSTTPLVGSVVVVTGQPTLGTLADVPYVYAAVFR